MSTVTTHVLDAVRGGPAAGVPVRLEERSSTDGRGAPAVLARASTDADGRVRDLGPEDLPAGDYRLVFDTAAYFRRTGTPALYPEVVVVFTVAPPAAGAAARYHVPLLLSPFSFSTYRGS